MRELGSASFEEHCAIIKLASESADKVFIHGNEMKKALASLSGLSNIFHFEEKSALIEKLIEVLQANDCLLVKGSRGMKMEEIITALKLNFV
jgi:UDP-N-acetylmuramoyl-tripeptide--D-alanyl-D-alanine ligase